ncbi:hypothetical protein C7974DRAFT_124437 [Boeremia exigua]|uniref:uncharacterized protein n=1 Tax=Boeremia exigua TaxID=749465 RepID=UPI001E8D62FE|nr:uncharacterized protein C7974DRAFT_124437 [Boeremia exigua]KAH6638984.1 hypothetical protein C7974DRAFT_124437 [Boeremia exigua]
MDHWGDPWADNANDKSPTKNAVTSPPPQSYTFAPVPLNGFVDDAGWGNNEDDGFGDWTTPDTGHVASTAVASTAAGHADPGSADWATVTYEEGEELSVKWPEPESSAPQDLEKVESEPSDSSTVSQLGEADSQKQDDESTQPQTDVESSVRSSTSPSETSRNELAVESPRTSIEDEWSTTEGVPHSEPPDVAANVDPIVVDPIPDITTQVEDDTDADESKAAESVEEEAAGTGDAHDLTSESLDCQSVSHTSVGSGSPPDDPATATTTQPHARLTSFVCDKALLAELFPSGKDSGKQVDEHDDPIFSTSARKAWYRLTRKQTMREYNHGENDDNYIRVTWSNSDVRSEVHKVVGRWAREDRISGTGPGARASFYWDTPTPAEPKAPFGHLRTQSSAPTPKTANPARQSLPPLASNQSAAFNWSSSATATPWELEPPVQRSNPTPLAPMNPVVAKLKRQEGRAASVDLTPRGVVQTTHKRTATVSHTASETTTVARSPSPVITKPSAEVLDPWTSSDSFSNPSTSTTEVVITAFDDDDDDWGEMVQTPTLPTPQQLDPFSQPSEAKVTLPPPPLPASSPPNISPVEPASVEPMLGAPIVRLQSTISPTSALFKAKSFIPLNAEQGPIGPGILKSANRSNQPNPEKKLKDMDKPEQASVETSNAATKVPIEDDSKKDAETSPWTRPPSSPLSLEAGGVGATTVNVVSLTPTARPATPVETSADSWADADFSFFESSLPVAEPQPSLQVHDPSDPFAFFEGPAPTATPPASKPYSRSPPPNPTPPMLQPLSGATSSLQQRKVEEEQIIDNILNGLPDLSYMLRP